MSTEFDSHGQTATLSKESPSDRGRDGRKTAHNDGSTASQSNPPTHHTPTHSIARFLWVTPKDTPISELGERYQRWQARKESEQTDLSGWDE